MLLYRKAKKNVIWLLILLCIQCNGQKNEIHLIGEFIDWPGARVFMYSQHIDTLLSNGKFHLILNDLKEGEYTIAVIFPKDAGTVVRAFRDIDGKVKTSKIKLATITLTKKFYINPQQATIYSFYPISNLTSEILTNYFPSTDNYKNTIFGISIKSNASDTKLYNEFEILKNNFEGEMTYKILDSLFKNDTRTDKIYFDFDSIAIKLNQKQNFNTYFSNISTTVKKNNSNPISALALLNLRKNDFESKKEDIRILATHLAGNAKQSEFYNKLNLRLKEIDDPLLIGKYFFNPKGKTPDLIDFKYNVSSSRFTLVEFWASWCVPCREDNPQWNLILNKYHNKGFNVLGISIDENLGRWRDAIKMDSLQNWTHVSDLAGGFKGYNGLNYKLAFVPTNVLLDSTGKIIYKNLKPFQIEKKLDSLFSIK